MVMMPLFTVLFSVPLHLSRTLLMDRVGAASLFTVMAVVYYRTASEKTGRDIGRFITLIAAFAMDIATYNGLFFLCVMLVYILLTKELTSRGAVILGTICSVSILCRQTSGVFLMIAVLIILLAAPALRRFTGWFIAGAASVMVLFAASLLITGSFADFWDCCLFALFSSGHNAAFSNDTLHYVLIIFIGIAADVVLLRKDKSKDHIYHLVLGAILITVGIPIVDLMHVCYAGLWFIIPNGELIKTYAGKNIKPVIMNVITAAAALGMLTLNVLGTSGTVTCSDYAELRGIPVYDGYLDGYAVIDEANREYRAEGKRVVILSSRACLFSIMDERFDPPFDLFLSGNLGTKEPVEIVDEVCGQGNVIILMPDDYPEENWENPEGVYESVVSHCTPFAQYGNFVWYRPVG